MKTTRAAVAALLSLAALLSFAACDNTQIDTSQHCTTAEDCEATADGRHYSCTGDNLPGGGFCSYELPCPCSIGVYIDPDGAGGAPGDGEADCETDADCPEPVGGSFHVSCIAAVDDEIPGTFGTGRVCAVDPLPGYVCEGPGHMVPEGEYGGGGAGGGSPVLP